MRLTTAMLSVIFILIFTSSMANKERDKEIIKELKEIKTHLETKQCKQ